MQRFIHSVINFMKQRFLCISGLFLGLIYLTQMLLFYPGIPNGDNIGQLAQAFGSESYNNHHPVLHTWILQGCMQIGRFVSDDNWGLFIYVILQNLFLFCVVMYALYYLIGNGLRMRYACILVMYYGLHPILQNYASGIIKDTWYAGFLLLLLIQIHKVLLCGSETTGRQVAGVFCCMLFMMLFRNDGIYMDIAVCIAMFFCGRGRCRSFILRGLVGLLACFLLWHHVIMPVTGVTEGSSREMLSLPFQQTARYVWNYSSEVTAEERDSINQVLEYDELAERYDPVNADPVKITYKEQASRREICSYFMTWAKMFVKHPEVYFQATWDNKAEFFIPKGIMAFSSVKDAEEIMRRIEREIPGVRISFHFPLGLSTAREYVENIRAAVGKYTPLLCLRIPCLYVWCVLWTAVEALCHRERIAAALCVPFVMNLLINIAGPMNGSYTRYMYLYILALPVGMSLRTIHGN